MARRAPVKKEPPQLNTYLVNQSIAGKMLGPYKINESEGGGRTVQLTTRQAQYWVDQGAITAEQ